MDEDRPVTLETSTEEELAEALSELDSLAGTSSLTGGAYAAVCMTRLWLKAEMEKRRIKA